MTSKFLSWILGFVLKLFGLKRIPEKQKDLEKKAKDAVEEIRQKQENRKGRRQDEWGNATKEQKQKMLLDRFTNNDSGN